MGGKYEIKSGDKLIESDYSKMYSTVGKKLFDAKNPATDLLNNAFTEATKEKTLSKIPNPSIKNQALYTRAKRVAKDQLQLQPK